MYKQMTPAEKRVHRHQLNQQLDQLRSRLCYWQRRTAERTRIEVIAQKKLDDAQEVFDRTMRDLDAAPEKAKQLQAAIAHLGQQIYAMDHLPRLDRLAELAGQIRDVEEIVRMADE